MVTSSLEVPKEGTLLATHNAFVLEGHRAKNGNIHVLLFLPNNMQHFATGIYIGPAGWISGHYFDNVNEALSDFLERS